MLINIVQDGSRKSFVNNILDMTSLATVFTLVMFHVRQGGCEGGKLLDAKTQVMGMVTCTIIMPIRVHNCTAMRSI